MAIISITNGIVVLGSSGNHPVADSITRVINTADWMIAGRPSNFVGKAGIPTEIEDREKKTNVW